MNLISDINDSLNESLVPLTNSTSKVRTRSIGTRSNDLGTSLLVDELTGRTRPVISSRTSLGEKIVEDLSIKLKGDLLGQNLSELNLSVKAVVSVKILSKLWRPTST